MSPTHTHTDRPTIRDASHLKRSEFCHIGFQGKHKKNKILRHKMQKQMKNETVKTQNILLMLEQQCRWLPGSRSAGV